MKTSKSIDAGIAQGAIDGLTSHDTMSRYANILMDYWFKRTFGSEGNKRLLILVLREIIPEMDIKDLSYTNREHHSPFPDEHGVVFDIGCISADGTRFVVEMQLAQQYFLMERALFYSTFSVQEQLKKGEETYSFMPVYFIALMDFSLHNDDPERFLYKYDILETTSGELMTDKLHFYFLELPKVRTISQSSTELEKFCYAMHNMTVLKSRPREMTSEIFEILFNCAEIAKFTPEEKVKYEHDMTTERDRRNQLYFSHEEGRKEGREEGRAEGREEGIVEGLEKGRAEGRKAIAEERESIAARLRARGFGPEEIREILGADPTK